MTVAARTGASAVVAALEERGVEYLFGVPGHGAYPIYGALTKGSSVKPIVGRNEQGISFIADAWSWVTNRVAVATTVPGVRLHQLLDRRLAGHRGRRAPPLHPRIRPDARARRQSDRAPLRPGEQRRGDPPGLQPPDGPAGDRPAGRRRPGDPAAGAGRPGRAESATCRPARSTPPCDAARSTRRPACSRRRRAPGRSWPGARSWRPAPRPRCSSSPRSSGRRSSWTGTPRAPCPRITRWRSASPGARPPWARS